MICIFGFVATLLVASLPMLKSSSRIKKLQHFDHLPLVALYAAGVPVLGLPAASALLTAILMQRSNSGLVAAIAWGLTLALFQIAFFSVVADITYEPLITGWLLARHL
jgi:hypothetical protein